MKQSDFNKLKIGDIIETKNRKGIVIGLGYTLAEVQYVDTKRRVWKSARQIKIERRLHDKAPKDSIPEMADPVTFKEVSSCPQW